MRIRPRYLAGLGLVLAGMAAAALVSSLAMASAAPRPEMTATVPGTTAGPPTTTATTDTTTTDTTTTGFCTGCIPRDSASSVPVTVTVNPVQPVAGETFEGISIHLYGGPGTISWVRCDAQIDGKRLPARQRSLYTRRHRTAVTCRWRIPKNAGGQQLRLWTHGLVIHTRPHQTIVGGVNQDIPPPWVIKRRGPRK